MMKSFQGRKRKERGKIIGSDIKNCKNMKNKGKLSKGKNILNMEKQN